MVCTLIGLNYYFTEYDEYRLECHLIKDKCIIMLVSLLKLLNKTPVFEQ